jgi:hypothetical protein
MSGHRPYRNPWYAADVRELRGRGWVFTDRDHGDGTTVYRVAYVSGGGDIYFKSMPIAVAEHADAACRVFCEFVGATADPTFNSTSRANGD